MVAQRDYCKSYFFQVLTHQKDIGTWNVRSMNQGKLEVVKQEMARLNINILGNKQTEMNWNGRI